MSIITSLIADTDNAAQREKMACLLTRLFNGDIESGRGLYDPITSRLRTVTRLITGDLSST
ncbi:hypothetical protein [Enterobacter cloacae]|uniref:hypothetical protein n=1 Tax=Enterobacter cloacae TaxID=550 RepID=UPI003D1C81D2